MSKEKEESNQENNEEVVNLNITDQKIDVLADGTEILRDGVYDETEEEEEVEEISDENLRKLLAFTTGQKNVSDEELETLRNNEVELERLIKISFIKSKHFTYAPKKKFHAAYKQNRKRKNAQAKRSRAINRR